MVQGDLRYFNPGDALPVAVLADSSGNVAQRGQMVGLVDESDGITRVELLETAGEGIGAIHRAPEAYDPSATYNAGDVVGTSTVHATGPVDWYEPSGSNTPAVNDLVVSDSGGTVRAYDSAGGDTADMIFGRVFATGTRTTAQTAGEVAVLRRI